MDSNIQRDNSAPDPAEIEAIELAAAEWLVRREQGLPADEQRAFEQWLARDPRHAKALARLGDTWQLLDAVPAERVPLPRRGRRGWWIAVPLAAAAALAVLFVRVERAPATEDVRHAVTSIGVMKVLTLADGSNVRLNTDSEIAVDFSPDERRVTLLRGEASFEVTKDRARPFVVRAGEVDVRVLGTVFNVRRDTERIEVLVVEGQVQLDEAKTDATPSAGAVADEPPQVLVAGQRATIERSESAAKLTASVASVAPAESARKLAWHNREVEFSDEPLERIAAEFNRYNSHRLVVEDAELAKKRFGGKFPANDFAALVRVLELNFGVVVERREHETVLRPGPAVR